MWLQFWIAILVNSLDSFFTWIIVKVKGGQELNPIMAYFIGENPVNLFYVKLFFFLFTALVMIRITLVKDAIFAGRMIAFANFLMVLNLIYSTHVLYTIYA
jgi:hypothetical protein